MRGIRRRHGRRGLRGGAAVQLVLPHDRLRRYPASCDLSAWRMSSTRKLTMRFDANVVGGLPWRFEPELNSVEVKVGEVVTVNYRVINQSARETVGIASYNVSPPTAGAYFSKINCFCFTEQRLKAGEKRDMAVVFFVDPEIGEGFRAGRSRCHHALLHHVSGAPAADAADAEGSLLAPGAQLNATG